MSLEKTMRSGKWRARCAALVLVASLIPLSGRAAAAEGEATLEYKVKAGYLFNFAKFVEWPAAAFPDARSPFVIGVLDHGEAAPLVQGLLQGREIDGRPLEVRSVSLEQARTGVHILFVTRAAGKSAEDVRGALGGAASVLVVGETDQFAERGGAIGFTVEDESIRLSLNLERAMEAGLKVSAKLASVARRVKPKRNS